MTKTTPLRSGLLTSLAVLITVLGCAAQSAERSGVRWYAFVAVCHFSPGMCAVTRNCACCVPGHCRQRGRPALQEQEGPQGNQRRPPREARRQFNAHRAGHERVHPGGHL